jgi:hypothetical protein
MADEFALPTEPVADEFAISEEENAQIDAAIRKRKAALTAVRSFDPGPTYQQILAEFESTGESSVYNQDRQFLNSMVNDMRRDAATVAIQESATPEEAEARLLSISEDVPEISTEEAALTAAAEAENPATYQEQQVQFLSREHITDMMTGPATKQLQNYLNMYDPNVDAGSVGNQIKDFAAAAIAPGFQLRYANALNNWKPGLLSASDWALPGNASEKAKQYLLSIADDPELFREEVKRLAEVMIEASKPLDFVTGEESIYQNEYELYDYWAMTVGDLFAEDDIWKDVGIMLDNAFGVLDLWLGFAGPVVRTGRAAWRAMRNSPIENIGQAAPGLARDVHIEITRTENSVTTIETSPPEVLGEDVRVLDYEHGLPKPLDDERRTIYDLADNFNINNDPELATDFQSLNFSPAEREAAQRRENSRINTLFGTLDDTMHMSNTQITDIPGGFSTSWHIGHTATHGFRNLQSAKDVAGRYREVLDGAEVTYMKRDFENGVWRPVGDDEPLDELGEYAMSIKQDYFYGESDLDPKTLEDGFFLGITGRFGKHFDPSSQYPEWFVNASNIASDRNSAITARLTEILKPISRLPERKQEAVFSLLEQQERAGQWYSVDQVWEHFRGQQEYVDAFFAHRKHTRAMRQLLNRRFYRQLRSEGYDSVEFRGLSNVDGLQLGRPIDMPAGRSSLKVYEPTTDSLRTASRDEIRNGLENGTHKLVEMRSPITVGRQQAKYVLVHNQSRAVRLAPLPTEVIREIPGYIPRIYDANFTVARVVRYFDENGRETVGRIPLAFARTREEAEAELRAQQDYFRSTNEAQGKAEELDILTSREQDSVLQATMRRENVEYYEATGQLFTSGRGRELRPLREGGMDGRYGMSTLSQAMEIATNRVARSTAEREFLDLAIARWETAYGKAFGTAEGRFPLIGEVTRSARVTENEGNLREATALRDHILRIAGIDNSMMSQAYRDSLLRTSDWFYNQGQWRAGDLALEASKAPPPTETAKRLSFVYNIVWNPLRQLVLQATQGSLYINAPGAAQYMVSPQGLGDYFSLAVRLMTPKADEYSSDIIKWADRSVKELGGNPAEANRLYEGFLRTGIAQATDSHQYHIAWSADPNAAMTAGRNALQTVAGAKSIPGMAWQTTRNGFTRATRLLRRAGFDLGENSHMMAAFLVERNRWMRENPKIADQWDTDINLGTIAGRTRQRSGNMNSAGALGFQRGSLSLATQFMSHTMKMAQIMIPDSVAGRQIPLLGKLSNKYYTNKERTRILFTQLGLFGTAAFGLDTLFEDALQYEAERRGEVIEMPEDVRMGVREGIIGTSLNMAARAAAGEDLFNMENYPDDQEVTDFQFSANFAPMSGLAGIGYRQGEFTTNPAVKIAETIFLQQSAPFAQLFLGASWTGVESFAKHTENALATMGFLPGIRQDMETKPREAIPAVLNEMMRIVPAYDKAFRARIIESGGRLITAGNELGVPTTEAEAWMIRMLGVKDTKEKRFGDYLRENQGYRVEVQEASSNRAEIRRTAKTLYDRVLAYARQYNDGEINEQEFQRLADFEHTITSMAYDEQEGQLLKQFFRERVFSDLNESQDAVLADLITRQRQTGDLRALDGNGDAIYKDATFISNFPDFPGKELVLEGMRWWHGASEE